MFQIVRNDKTNEVRLALVLYGGVALAIYINGAVNELLKLVRAGLRKQPPEGEEPYILLKELLDAEVTVDVISGTSAGGINGIFLAKALANNYEMDGLATLWREKADILMLMRKPSDGEPRSLLDDRYMFQSLTDAFELMGQRGVSEYDPSRRDLDLFVTATNLHGALNKLTDESGSAIDTLSYGEVFHLKFRGEGDPSIEPMNMLKDENNRLLAKIARATSSFPVAFRPVLITAEEKHGIQGGQQCPHNYWYMDGGVLDNKPFTMTIRQIFRRAADKKIYRKLLYVEPDPESFSLEKEDLLKAEPSFLTVLGKAFTIPQYDSITEDLRSLGEHNARVTRVNDYIQMLLNSKDLGVMEGLKADGSSRSYMQLRCKLLVDTLMQNLSDALSERGFEIETVKGLKGVIEKALRGPEGVLSLPDEWTQQTDIEEIRQRFESYDSLFALRRIYYFIDYIAKSYDRYVLYKERGLSNALSAKRFLSSRKSKLHQLARQIRAEGAVNLKAFTQLLHESSAAAAGSDATVSVESRLENAVKQLVAWVSGGRPAAVSLSAGKSLTSINQQVLRIAQELDSDLTNEITQYFKREPDRITAHPFVEALEGFLRVDMLTYPVEAMFGLGERVKIGFTRISPKDATRLGRSVENKLAGDTLGHFGGFLKKRWRENDILWGQLDAAETLITTLAGDLDFERFSRDAELVEKALHFLKPTPFVTATRQQQAQLRDSVIQVLQDPINCPARSNDPTHEALFVLSQEDRRFSKDIRNRSLEKDGLGTDDPRFAFLVKLVNRLIALRQVAICRDAFHGEIPGSDNGGPSKPAPAGAQAGDYLLHYQVGTETVATGIKSEDRLRLSAQAVAVLAKMMRTLSEDVIRNGPGVIAKLFERGRKFFINLSAMMNFIYFVVCSMTRGRLWLRVGVTLSTLLLLVSFAWFKMASDRISPLMNTAFWLLVLAFTIEVASLAFFYHRTQRPGVLGMLRSIFRFDLFVFLAAAVGFRYLQGFFTNQLPQPSLDFVRSVSGFEKFLERNLAAPLIAWILWRFMPSPGWRWRRKTGGQVPAGKKQMAHN